NSAAKPMSSHIVSVISLNELLRGISVRRIKLMKIDVEGYESEVFKGLDLTSDLRPEHILMEHSQRLDQDISKQAACFDLLRDHGYQAFTVTGQHFDPTRKLPEENIWWRSHCC